MNNRQIAIGLFALLAGSLVYLADRPPQATWFVQAFPFSVSLHSYLGGFLGPLGRYLPAFVHVFALALVTGGFLGGGMVRRLSACLFWLATDLAFEFGQKFPEQATSLVPDWFSHIPFLDQTSRYFINGSYHPLDVLATVLGALAAYGVLLITEKPLFSKNPNTVNPKQDKQEGWT
ncbi:MAG: hypothetical protein JEZ02_13590 [Desulfatibacillum sp.]|nr:hypothetical protein [Desulfatibacillum sp.]